MSQMKPISNCLRKTFGVAMILSVLCLSGSAFAFNSDNAQSRRVLLGMTDSIGQNYQNSDDSTLRSVVQPLRHSQAQSNSSSFRSKSDVMREVKSRYNGQVVKISLNERSATYHVRVLLPNGKVKNLSINARK